MKNIYIFKGLFFCFVFWLESVDLISWQERYVITCQSASALREEFQRRYVATQISQQDPRGVFAPLFAELNVEVRVETVASLGWLEGEEAEIKQDQSQNSN